MNLELPTYRCRKIAEAITIDGDLGKPAWRGIEAISLVLSDGSGAPSRPTQLRICWNESHLYLAFSCADPDIWGNYLSHDDPIYEEEVVEAFLCPSLDLTRYFEFELSPRNVQFDALVHNPGEDRQSLEIDTSWDCAGWLSAVVVNGTLDDRTDTDRQWTAEMAIPFASLPGLPHCPPKPDDEWRANFYRIDRTPTPEFSAWSPTLRVPADFHVPSCFGHLVFAP